ncbi:MAG: hypothetical protein AABY22_11995 [Nanoarchaeota archaeon]
MSNQKDFNRGLQIGPKITYGTTFSVNYNLWALSIVLFISGIGTVLGAIILHSIIMMIIGFIVAIPGLYFLIESNPGAHMGD